MILTSGLIDGTAIELSYMTLSYIVLGTLAITLLEGSG